MSAATRIEQATDNEFRCWRCRHYFPRRYVTYGQHQYTCQDCENQRWANLRYSTKERQAAK